MRTLGIETSCDETGVAIFEPGSGLLANRLYSQAALHAEYGGVVPELASRDHLRKLLPLVDQVLTDAGGGRAGVGGIAYTAGPGLVGALLVGAGFARALAMAWGVPALGVHHMEAHLLAPMLEDEPPPFPFVALLVSGGHTQLVDVQGLGRYRLLGESLDDAAGEAFDKVAKLLGLGYPGGPALAALAEEGDPERFDLPRPMTGKPGLDFSFSGLKTATLYRLRDLEAAGEVTPADRADLAASFQRAVVATLVIKCRRALEATGRDVLVIAGGVSANRELRAALEALPARLFCPRPEFCTDNGAMVAHLGALRLATGQRDGSALDVRARWPMESLSV